MGVGEVNKQELEEVLTSEDVQPIGDADEGICAVLQPSGKAAEALVKPSKVHLQLRVIDGGTTEGIVPEISVTARVGRGELPRVLEDGVHMCGVGDIAAIRCAPASMMHHKVEPLSELQRFYHLDTVVTLVRLNDVEHARDLYGDDTAIKTRIAHGTGEAPRDFPLKDCPVRAKVLDVSDKNDSSTLLEKMLDNAFACTEEWYELGIGMLPEAIEAALRVMVPNERADVTDSNTNKRWLCELQTFESVPDLRMCSGEEALTESQRSRGKAAEAFKSGRVASAAEKLSILASNLDSKRHASESADIADAVRAERARVYASEAAARAHLGDDRSAIQCAENALKEDSSNNKALYQLAHARIRVADTDGAESAALCMDEGNARDRALAQVKRTRMRERMQEKNAFGGMFERSKS